MLAHWYVLNQQRFLKSEISTEADTGIIIPANSQIINFYVLIQTAWDGGTNTLDIGISGNSDLYCDGLPATVVGNHRVTAAYTGTEANWKDIGTSDVTLYIKSVATGSGGWCFDGSIPSK